MGEGSAVARPARRWRRVALANAVALVVLATACGSHDLESASTSGTTTGTGTGTATPFEPDPVATPETTAAGSPAASPVPEAPVSSPTFPAGCDNDQSGNAIVGGQGRRVLVRAPASESLRPAVVVLHGYTGDPESIEASSGWTPFARQVGAVVAYPEGTPTGRGGFGWNTGSAAYSTSGVDDPAFLTEVVDHLVATACVDPSRIMIAGESNGGAMTVIAACAPVTRDRFAFFAPVIPAVDQGVLDRCGDGPPLSFTAIAGRLDTLITYDGAYGPGEQPMLGQEEWVVGLAAARNGCDTDAPTREPIDGGELVRPAGCPQTPLLIAVDDGVHVWPGGPRGTSLLDPGRFPTTAYLWDAFTAR